MPDSFADSNVLLYLLSDDELKRRAARDLLEAGVMVSVQVLNEIVSVSRRKHWLEWSEIGEFIDDLRPLLSVTPLTLETHMAGRTIASRYGFAFYDSLIVAAAIETGCTVLFSEDLQDGQKIGNLTITNPFR